MGKRVSFGKLIMKDEVILNDLTKICQFNKRANAIKVKKETNKLNKIRELRL